MDEENFSLHIHVLIIDRREHLMVSRLANGPKKNLTYWIDLAPKVIYKRYG